MAKQSDMPTLSDEAAAAYEKFTSLAERMRKANALKKDRDSQRAIVLLEMGEHTRCRLPDGRILQRIPKTRNVSAQKARVDAWEELICVEE